MKLKRGFLALLVFVSVLLVLTVSAGFQVQKSHLVEHKETEISIVSGSIASDLENRLEDKRRVVELWSENPSIDDHGSERQRSALKKLAQDTRFEGASVIDRSGEMTNIYAGLNRSQRQGLLGEDFGDRTYFERAVEGESYVGRPFHAESGNWVVTVSAPIVRNGTVVGTLNGAYHLSNTSLFDSVGEFVDSGQSVRISTENQTLYGDRKAGAEAFTRSSVTSNGLVVTVSEDKSSLNAPLRRASLMQAGGILVVLLTLGGFGYWLYRRDIDQIEKLLEGFEALKSGRYSTELDLSESYEWGRIKSGFSSLSSRLEEREEELEQQRARLRTLFDRAPDAIIVHDGEGVIIDVNQATLDALGYEREELLGMGVEEIEVGWSQEELIENCDKLDVGDQIQVEGRHRRKDGSTFPVEVWISKVEIDGEYSCTALTRDISERKRREDELQVAKKRLEEAQEVGDIGHWIWDIRTEELEWSDQVFRILGLEPGEVEPEYETFYEYVHPDDEEKVRGAIEDALENNNYDIDHRIVRPSGEERTVHEKGEIEYMEGEPVRMLGTVQDITKESELEGELRRKYEELSLLNRITRHDIRNDMNVILGWSLELKETEELESPDRLEKIIEKSQHVIDLTETAREFVEATSEDEKIEAQDLSSILEGVVQTRKSTFEDRYFETGDLPKGAEVKAGSLLSTVFRNLLNNAIQHNDKDEPRVKISTEEQEDSVIVDIADNGSGIPDEQKETIFGKGEKGLESGGTGIGLYLVKTLIDNYDGAVWIEDNEPEGTVFKVELKRA